MITSLAYPLERKIRDAGVSYGAGSAVSVSPKKINCGMLEYPNVFMASKTFDKPGVLVFMSNGLAELQPVFS